MGKKIEKKPVEGRRDFLKLASLGTVLGGATLAAGRTANAEVADEVKSSGYQETSHVKKYYELTRF